ncbi:hypothetical protein MRX96_052833 [Rhipicephalus microplus]
MVAPGPRNTHAGGSQDSPHFFNNNAPNLADNNNEKHDDCNNCIDNCHNDNYDGQVYNTNKYNDHPLNDNLDSKYNYSSTFWNVTPYGVDAASGDLDSLREQGIRHYGLLTVLSYQKDFQDTLRSTKRVLEVGV